ncbi:MAG: pyrroloquinoline quinone biosynthesis protein PqqB [Paracoccaceae bacterium]
MKIRILGAAAGGGLPQWNCGCRNCVDARAGHIAAMTQSSVAVSADGNDWLVLNASPDIRAQLQAAPVLQPKTLRGSPVRAVLVTNADVDHIAGLLTLRENTAFTLFATTSTLQVLSQPVFRVLNADLVSKVPIVVEQEFSPLPGLSVTAFAVPGKVALFLEEGEPDTKLLGEQTVGLRIASGEQVLFYIPGCADVPDDLVARIGGADLLLFDGTVWGDDDMPRSGTGKKTGARMGHMPMSGPEGSMVRLAEVGIGRRMFIHINNTNPVLQADAPERAAMAAAGWELAHDGMEITL